MDKIQALQWHFEANGMLCGFGFSPNFGNTTNHGIDMTLMDDSKENEAEDEAIVSGESKGMSEFDVQLAARARVYPQISRVPLYSIVDLAECGYPSHLHALVVHIKQPEFPPLFSQFLYKRFHLKVQVTPSTLKECPTFNSAIKVYHSAVATFYAPSDLSGSGGLQCQQIQSTPHFFGHLRRDTVFVITDDSWIRMKGMEIRRILLLFSSQYWRKEFSCMLIEWFVHPDKHDPDTGMWTVTQECNCHRCYLNTFISFPAHDHEILHVMYRHFLSCT